MEQPEPPLDRLFVYGTLAPGQANHHVMSDIPRLTRRMM